MKNFEWGNHSTLACPIDRYRKAVARTGSPGSFFEGSERQMTWSHHW